MRNSKKVQKTKRDLIIDAGIRLFARFPFSEITIAAVAREADCGHSLVYHYFRNVNELYEESVTCVTSYFAPYVKSIDQKETSPLILFVGAISSLIALLNKEPMSKYYLSLIIFQYAEVPKCDRISKLRNKWYKASSIVITNGIDSGVLLPLLTGEEIIKNLQHQLQGIVSSLIFGSSKDETPLHASPLYLPFLKGVHNA